MDNLPFLEGESPVEDVQPQEVVETPPVAEAPVAEAAPEAPADGRVRDERGRFAPKEEAKAPAEPTQPPPGYVPVGVVQSLRDKVRQLEAAQQPAPDIFENTDGYIDQRVMQPVQHQITTLNLNWSRKFAEQAFGAEAVNTAEQWVMQKAAEDPTIGQRIIASPDPYGAAVAEYKQHQVLSQLSDPSRIDAFLAWEAAQRATQQQQPAVPAQAEAAPPTPTPTRSLATAPSSGGAAHVPTGPGQAFDSLFKG